MSGSAVRNVRAFMGGRFLAVRPLSDNGDWPFIASAAIISMRNLWEGHAGRITSYIPAGLELPWAGVRIGLSNGETVDIAAEIDDIIAELAPRDGKAVEA